MDDALMRIGEIAAFFGVSVKAMRIYERMGILKPAKVDPKTGYRYYAPDQVKQLDALLELRELGFTLGEIRALLHSGTTRAGHMEALARKRAMWQDAMAKAREKIETLDELIESLALLKPSVKLRELTEDERAHLLSRIACMDSNLHDVHARNILSEALWL